MPRLEIRPGTPLSRSLALALAGLALLVLWAGLAEPLIGLVGGENRLGVAARRLAEQRAISARQPLLAANKAALLRAGPNRADFLPGASPSLAAADLQGRIESLIKPLGGSVASVETLSLPDEEGFRRAGLRLKLTLRPESLAPLLYAIETDRPRLLLSALTVKSGGSGDLSLAMELFGYLAPEAP